MARNARTTTEPEGTSMTVTVNHFHMVLNYLWSNENESGQAGFYTMAADATLPTPYKVNENLPEKELLTGFWSGTNALGAWTSTWLGNTGTSFGAGTDLSSIFSAIKTYDDALKPLRDSNVKFVGATITPYNSARESVAGRAVFTMTTPTSGTGTSVHPVFTSLAVGWRGPSIGQSQRGRMYVPLTGLTLTSPGYTVASSTRTTVASALSLMWQDLNTNYSTRAVVVHKTSKLLPPGYEYTTYSDISQIRINSQPDTFKTRGSHIIPSVTTTPAPW